MKKKSTDNPISPSEIRAPIKPQEKHPAFASAAIRTDMYHTERL